MTALYNELDPYASQWTRNLIAGGHVAPGRVDDRSISEIRPDDLRGVAQFHAFSGIAVWSHALRLAGWPDDRPVWTGSAPCQPFSSAGRGRGFDDERHLWPVWFGLIRACRPAVILGEQVASPAGLGWFDAVRSDLEGEGYACRAFDLCAASVGAPHIRQRLYFVAVANADDRGQRSLESDLRPRQSNANRRRADDAVADAGGARHDRREDAGTDPGDARARAQAEGRRAARHLEPKRGGAVDAMADASRAGLAGRPREPGDDGAQLPAAQRDRGDAGAMAHAGGERRGGVGLHLLEGEPREAITQAPGRRKARGGPDASSGGRREGSVPREGAGGRGPGPADGRGLVHAHGERAGRDRGAGAGAEGEGEGEGGGHRDVHHRPLAPSAAGHWSDVEWLHCSDGKARPAPAGIHPLADRTPFRVGLGGTVESQPRVGLLRGYGNAIVPQVAATFIQAVMDILPS